MAQLYQGYKELNGGQNPSQFVGEYTKAIDLATYTKAIYFLEITTNNGIINKKLILQQFHYSNKI